MKRFLLLVMLFSLAGNVSAQRFYHSFIDFSVERPQHVVFDNETGALYQVTWLLKSLDLLASSAHGSRQHAFDIYVDVEEGEGDAENFARLRPHPSDIGFFLLEVPERIASVVDATIAHSIKLGTGIKAFSRCDDTVVYRISTNENRTSVWTVSGINNWSFEWARQDGLTISMWRISARVECVFNKDNYDHLCNAWMVHVEQDEFFDGRICTSWLALRDGTQYWYAGARMTDADARLVQSVVNTFSGSMRGILEEKNLLDLPAVESYYQDDYPDHNNRK